LAAGNSRSTMVPEVIETAGFWPTAVTLTIGLLSGLAALRLRIPTGDLIGPILVVGGVNLLGAGLGTLGESFRQLGMLLIGTAVGAQMSRESLRLLRQVALPAAALILTLIGIGLGLGWGLSRVTSLDLASALLSSVPGGASTLPAVAHDLGGDMRLVAALHLTRQLVIFILLPALLGHLLRGRQHSQASLIGSERLGSNK
jgi:membrane AbrB-like protein